jgi:cytochrome o ubiquinol oxidase subunit 2
VTKNTKKQLKILAVVGLVWFGLIVALYAARGNFQVLNPAGEVAEKQRNLIVLTLLLGLLVVLPVFVMTFAIAWKYREGNKKAKYSPDLSGNLFAESLWWGIPGTIILVLSVVTWNSSHTLDPRRTLSSGQPPIKIQVVALDWKWLFIYPEQGIASVNYVQFPVDKPVQFEITSDAPMNSFWIPQLGSQIYAMSGMSTHLNLMANKVGDFRGSSANLSGAGFSSMDFTAHSSSESDFKTWAATVKEMPDSLSMGSYNRLAMPSKNNPAAYYSSVDTNLYEQVVNKYMAPGGL